MRLVSFSKKPAAVRHGARPDVHQLRPRVRHGHYVYQGNFAGFTIWDVSNPAKPGRWRRSSSASRRRAIRRSSATCSSSPPRARATATIAAKGGVQDPKDHMAGVRIFDVSNPKAPKLVKNVQTCKGSHTHTLVPEPEGPRSHLHLRVGTAGRAAGNGAGGMQERHGPGGPDELALPARHHQGAARSPRAGRR